LRSVVNVTRFYVAWTVLLVGETRMIVPEIIEDSAR
jgi:hypothetical protein